MRVTSSMMMSSYMDSISSDLDRINSNSDQISSEQKFSRGSEDPVAAMKTLKANHSLTTIEGYQSSCSEMTSWMQATESAIQTLNSVLTDASGTITSAVNGTMNSSDDVHNATALTNYQQEILQALNSTFNGRYVFGASESDPAPFKVGDDSDGASAKGKLMSYDYKTKTYQLVSGSGINADNKNSYKLTMPVDLGMGLKLDSSNNVVEGTVLEGATSALDFLCQKVNSQNTNIYDELGKVVDQLNSGDHTGITKVVDTITDCQDKVLNTQVEVGEKTKMIQFMSNKMVTDKYNITTKISDLQDTDITEAIANLKMSQMVYDASLSISSSVLQRSLIDFLK